MSPSRLFRTAAICLSLGLGLSLAPALPVHAQEAAGAKTCAAEAAEKKLSGKQRRNFMAACREKNPEEAKKAEACRKEAEGKSLEGDARKAFMKTCLAKS